MGVAETMTWWSIYIAQGPSTQYLRSLMLIPVRVCVLEPDTSLKPAVYTIKLLGEAGDFASSPPSGGQVL